MDAQRPCDPQASTAKVISSPRPRKKKRKFAPKWIPNQHGAWAMLIAPFLMGLAVISATKPSTTIRTETVSYLILAVLFTTWIVGYFAYFATALWLRSGRKTQYFSPVRAYGIATGILGVILLTLAPQVLIFTPVYVPLLLVTLWCAHRRRDRSLLSGACTVAAACLMTPVTVSSIHRDLLTDLRDQGLALNTTTAMLWAFLMAFFLFAYFFGTVLYVKTVIRERENPRYAKASILYHGAMTVGLTAVAWLVNPGSAIWVAIAFSVLTIRAWAVAGRRVRPARIGMGELCATIAVLAVCLVVLAPR